MRRTWEKIWYWFKKEIDRTGIALTMSEVGFWIDREELLELVGEESVSRKGEEERE